MELVMFALPIVGILLSREPLGDTIAMLITYAIFVLFLMVVATK